MKQNIYKTIDVKDINGDSLQSSILRTLAYFDIFNYPLNLDEICEYSDYNGANPEQVLPELNHLENEGIIKNSGSFYFMGNYSCVEKRLQANHYSEKLMQKALKYARIISYFPFVKSISISGSLSKNNADANADVDYFIITKQNRLWICRTLLAVYKRIFLLNSSKYFCINYFVDTANLEIHEKNIYTATEIAFLIPVFHYENFFRFLDSNSWVNSYYPKKRIEITENMKSADDSLFKKSIEFLLDNRFGNMVDDLCLSLNIFYRRLKFRRLNNHEWNENLRSTKGVSKHHPNSYQMRILKKYEEKLAIIKESAGFELI